MPPPLLLVRLQGYIDPMCNIRVMPKLIPNKEVARQIARFKQDGFISRM